MNWFAKLERKFGRYAIHNLMRYMTAFSLAGTLLGLLRPDFYYNYLSLNVYEILHGQVWRIVTFLLYPSLTLSVDFIISVIFYGVMLYAFLWIGTILERAWGTFRFNAFYFTGILLMIVVSFAYYFMLLNLNGSGVAQKVGYYLAMQFDLDDLNWSMFLAFAFLFPDTEFLLYFVIPIKAKWLGFLNLFVFVSEIVDCVGSNDYRDYMRMFLLIATLINFVVFYLIARRPLRFGANVRQKKRRVVYKNMAQQNRTGTKHRCVICGRTEEDAPQLEFRYCSKCEGNYEYCSEHLFTHEHVKRNPINEHREH